MDELYQNLVRLSPKEQVPFRCIGCGACCKHVHMQVPVETLDSKSKYSFVSDSSRPFAAD